MSAAWKRITSWWFNNKQTEEGELFKERVIRTTNAVLFFIAVLNMGITYLYEGNHLLFTGVSIVTMIIMFVSIYALNKGKLSIATSVMEILMFGSYVMIMAVVVNYPDASFPILYIVVTLVLTVVLVSPKQMVIIELFYIGVAIYFTVTRYDPEVHLKTPSEIITNYVLLIGLSVAILYAFGTIYRNTVEKLAIAVKNASEAWTQLNVMVTNWLRMVRSIMHDLRPTLQSAKSRIKKLIQQTDDESLISDLTKVLNAIDRVLETLHAFQVDSQDISAEPIVKIKEVNLAVVAGTVRSTLAAIAESKGVVINLNLFSETGIIEDEYDSQCVIYTDGDLIERILSNLVNNAIKFTPDGGTIAISVNFANDDVVFSINDDGRGIPSSKIETIFQDYVQIEDEDGKIGYGLGLPIVLDFAEALGGSISVESQMGEGSTFTVTIPNGITS